eukprot:maker-scaffold169_size292178-snap-gene-0.14 protein:Tk07932 transcript:maker-scaffold169_size292178-snap-gene-0.14-mRNA-1 annotation:"hypothetical protein UV8b_3565"
MPTQIIQPPPTTHHHHHMRVAGSFCDSVMASASEFPQYGQSRVVAGSGNYQARGGGKSGDFSQRHYEMSGGAAHYHQPYYSSPLPKHGQPMSQCANNSHAFQSQPHQPQTRWGYDMSQGYHQYGGQVPQHCYDRHPQHHYPGWQAANKPQAHPQGGYGCDEAYFGSGAVVHYQESRMMTGDGYLPDVPSVQRNADTATKVHRVSTSSSGSSPSSSPSVKAGENKMRDDLKSGELDSSKFDMPLTPYSNNPPTPSDPLNPLTPLPSFQAASTPYHEVNYPPTPAYSDLQSPNSECQLQAYHNTTTLPGLSVSGQSEFPHPSHLEADECEESTGSLHPPSAGVNEEDEIFVPLHELIGSTLGGSDATLLTQTDQALHSTKQTHAISSSGDQGDGGVNDADNFMMMRESGDPGQFGALDDNQRGDENLRKSTIVVPTNENAGLGCLDLPPRLSPKELSPLQEKPSFVAGGGIGINARAKKTQRRSLSGAPSWLKKRCDDSGIWRNYDPKEMSDTLEMALNDMNIALRNSHPRPEPDYARPAEVVRPTMVRLEFKAENKPPGSSLSLPAKLSLPAWDESGEEEDDDKNRGCSTSLGGLSENDTLGDMDKVDLSNFMREQSQQTQADDDDSHEAIHLPFKLEALEMLLRKAILGIVHEQLSSSRLPKSWARALEVQVDVKTYFHPSPGDESSAPGLDGLGSGGEGSSSSADKGIQRRLHRKRQRGSNWEGKTNDQDFSERKKRLKSDRQEEEKVEQGGHHGPEDEKELLLFSLSILPKLESEASMSTSTSPSGQTLRNNNGAQQPLTPMTQGGYGSKTLQPQATKQPVSVETDSFMSGGSGGNSSPAHNYHCSVCSSSFPLSEATLADVCQHVATGIDRPSRGHSAIFQHFQQKVKLIVNNHRGVSIATELRCLKCPEAFAVTADNPNVILECFRHLIARHHSVHLESFCIFCDQKVPPSHMESHMNDSRLRSVHLHRLQALLTCFCTTTMNHRQKDLLSISSHDKLTSSKNAIYTPPKPDDSCCQICQSHFQPHPALPRWLAQSACAACAQKMIECVPWEAKKCVVLCHFCKQGKYGYKIDAQKTFPPRDTRDVVGLRPPGAVCVNCLNILDVFTVSRQKNSRECFNYVQGMLKELLNRLPRHSSSPMEEPPASGVPPGLLHPQICPAKKPSSIKPAGPKASVALSPKKQVAIVPPEPRAGGTTSPPNGTTGKCSQGGQQTCKTTHHEHLTYDKITLPMEKVLECYHNKSREEEEEDCRGGSGSMVPLIEAGLLELPSQFGYFRPSDFGNPERIVSSGINGDFAQELFGAGGQLQVKGVSKSGVDVVEKVQCGPDLLLDLVGATEDVSIVLLEASHPSEPGQSATELIPVEHPKVSHSQGQLFPGPNSVVKDEAVTRAVHGLEAELLLVDLESEHVVG